MRRIGAIDGTGPFRARSRHVPPAAPQVVPPRHGRQPRRDPQSKYAHVECTDRTEGRRERADHQEGHRHHLHRRLPFGEAGHGQGDVQFCQVLPQSRNQELAGQDHRSRDDVCSRQAVDADQNQQHQANQQLVGDRIEQPPEAGDQVVAACQPAIQEVGPTGDDPEHQRRPRRGRAVEGDQHADDRRERDPRHRQHIGQRVRQRTGRRIGQHWRHVSPARSERTSDPAF